MFAHAAMEKRLRQLEEEFRIAQDDSRAPREIITSLSKTVELLTNKVDKDIEMHSKLDTILAKFETQSGQIEEIKIELKTNKQEMESVKNQQKKIVKSLKDFEEVFDKRMDDSEKNRKEELEELENEQNKVAELVQKMEESHVRRDKNCRKNFDNLNTATQDIEKNLASVRETVTLCKESLTNLEDLTKSRIRRVTDARSETKLLLGTIIEKVDLIEASNIGGQSDRIEKILSDIEELDSAKIMESLDGLNELVCKALVKLDKTVKYEDDAVFQCRNCSKKLPKSTDKDRAYVQCPNCEATNIVGRKLALHRWAKIHYCNHYQQRRYDEKYGSDHYYCSVCSCHGRIEFVSPELEAPLWKPKSKRSE